MTKRIRLETINYSTLRVRAGRPGSFGLLLMLQPLIALIDGIANKSQGGVTDDPFGIVMEGMAGLVTAAGS